VLLLGLVLSLTSGYLVKESELSLTLEELMARGHQSATLQPHSLAGSKCFLEESPMSATFNHGIIIIMYITVYNVLNIIGFQ
jgi:hypothetical protein